MHVNLGSQREEALRNAETIKPRNLASVHLPLQRGRSSPARGLGFFLAVFLMVDMQWL